VNGFLLAWVVIAAIGVGVMLQRITATLRALRLARHWGEESKIWIAQNHVFGAAVRLYVVSFNLAVGTLILVIPTGTIARHYILPALSSGLILAEALLILASFRDARLERRLLNIEPRAKPGDWRLKEIERLKAERVKELRLDQ
jgi:hypothetical protein